MTERDFDDEDCSNRVNGRCPGCKRDYDLNHHPNNLDCRNYHPVPRRDFHVMMRAIENYHSKTLSFATT